MHEVYCFRCHCQLCWMTDCGPTGLHYCNSCKEDDDREEEERKHALEEEEEEEEEENSQKEE